MYVNYNSKLILKTKNIYSINGYPWGSDWIGYKENWGAGTALFLDLGGRHMGVLVWKMSLSYTIMICLLSICMFYFNKKFTKKLKYESVTVWGSKVFIQIMTMIQNSSQENNWEEEKQRERMMS